MNITVTIDDRQVQQALTALQQRLSNMKPVFEQIGQYYEARVLENFAKESSPDGIKWAPLSASTIMGRLGRKDGKGKRPMLLKSGALSAKGKQFLTTKAILFQEGYLRKSIHHQSTQTSVLIGTSSIEDVGKYAAIHQFGGPAGTGRKVTIPARPYLAVNKGESLDLAPRDRDEIVSILHRYLSDVVEGRK